MKLVDNDAKPEVKPEVKQFPKTKKNVWRLEGKEFFEIRKLATLQDKTAKECQVIMENAAKECHSKMKKGHEALWNRIWGTLGLDKSQNYSLDTSNADAGLYIVRVADKSKHDNNLLAAILKGLLE